MRSLVPSSRRSSQPAPGSPTPRLRTARVASWLIAVVVLCAAAIAQAPGARPATGIAAGSEKFLGNVMRGGADPEFADRWNQVTPENAGKWLSVEAVRGTMVWVILDQIYEYARAHGIPVKQHVFVWGQQEPRWVAGLPPEEQLQEVDEWMRLFAERYPDTAIVDVVNEAVHAPPSYIEALGGAGETGWDWVIWAFERAREYLPNAILVTNEYNILCCERDRAAYLDLVALLHERGLIDGIGLQAHDLHRVSSATITSSLDEIAALGLPIYISELDLEASSDQAQLELYQRVFPLLWEHEAVAGVTLWGYRAGQMWRRTAYLLDWFDEERPALVWLREYIAANP